MRITLVEPFFTGSHAQWARGLQAHSSHEVELLQLPGRFWKWRMYGGAVTLAQRFLAKAKPTDLILATDMLDLTTFLALSRTHTARLPVALYFHENQWAYPWSPTDPDLPKQRNNQYAFLNYTSALAADQLFFNSQYHLDAFVGGLPDFLRQFPDYRGLEMVPGIAAKSEVLPLGLDLQSLDIKESVQRQGPPVILWNHRWEYDKNPEDFFKLLFRLQEEGFDFRLLVLGQQYTQQPAIFAEAKEKLQSQSLHFGYVEDRKQYLRYLWQADLLPVTSRQDFFGGSIVEAMYCGLMPLLPNRLAYPEHIPDSEKSMYIYEHTDELYRKLTQAMRNIDAVREQAASFRRMVEHYDWSRLIGHYDEELASVIA